MTGGKTKLMLIQETAWLSKGIKRFGEQVRAQGKVRKGESISIR